MRERFDVCVIGGGPAGSALALRLAMLGRSVVLVEKARFPRSHVGESLTGGIVPLLEVLGVRGAIESAGFIHAPQATVRWAGELNRRDTHGGYQVDRGVFDDVLLRCARDAGALVLQPARVVDFDYGKQWSLKLDTGELLRAHFVADTAGRSRVLGGVKKASGARTLAMYAYWSDVRPSDTDTLVEAGSQQWYWGAPLPEGTFNATVFVDPERANPDGYRYAIRESRLLSARLLGAVCGPVRVCDATCFLDEILVTGCSIQAGDAALTIDPLSSQGVQTAIGTALHAAVVVNTMIERPGDADLAMDFYRWRIRDSARIHAAAARQLYSEQFSVTPERFWARRAFGQSFGTGLCGNVPRVRVQDRYIVRAERG